jgi:hypothetical protein
MLGESEASDGELVNNLCYWRAEEMMSCVRQSKVTYVIKAGSSQQGYAENAIEACRLHSNLVCVLLIQDAFVSLYVCQDKLPETPAPSIKCHSP